MLIVSACRRVVSGTFGVPGHEFDAFVIIQLDRYLIEVENMYDDPYGPSRIPPEGWHEV